MGGSKLLARLRRRRLATVVLSAVLAGPAILSGSPGAASAPQPEWSVQSTPPIQGHLNAVSCPSKNTCVAVGGTGGSETMGSAAHWNGTSWTILPITGQPTSEFRGVSCTAPDACVAVGSYISADADNLVAAKPVVARWNGLAWVIQRIPDAPSGALAAVSCTTKNACTAVGWSGGKGLVMRWNGLAWTIQANPQPVGSSTVQLLGVSCTSRSSCVAVGDSRSSGGEQALALHWNGAGWAIQPSPAAPQSSLRGLSCTSADSCTAVGWSGDNTYAARWDGTSWSAQAAPNQAGQRYNRMFAVSCASATSCVAAGHYNNPAAPTPAAWRWDGSTWTIQTLPLPASAIGGQLMGVSCTSATLCTAVGRAYDAETTASAQRGPLVERLS